MELLSFRVPKSKMRNLERNPIKTPIVQRLNIYNG